METTVINLHLTPSVVDAPGYVYVGRPSQWGNPYELPENATIAQRHRVIIRYAEWLLEQDHLMKHVDDLRGKILGCWCLPKLCHAGILAFVADNGPSALRERLKFMKEIAEL